MKKKIPVDCETIDFTLYNNNIILYIFHPSNILLSFKITRYHEIIHSSPYAGFGNGRHGLRVSSKKTRVLSCHVAADLSGGINQARGSANFSVVKRDCIAAGSGRPSMERMDFETPELSILYSVLASSLFQLRSTDVIDQCN